MTRLATLLAVLMALTACSSRTAPPASSSTAPPPSTTSTTSSSTPPPTPTVAADGKNLTACADGICEVRVAAQNTIQLNPALGISAITITSIAGDEVSTAITLAGSSFSIDCTGDDHCETSIVGTTPPAAYAVGHPGAHITINKVTIEVAAAENGTAILRLTAGP